MEQWQQILRVSLRGAPMPITGKYTVEGGMIRFTPMFDFDNWRSFEVTFEATKIPGADPSEPWRTNTVTKMIAFEGMGIGRAFEVMEPSADERDFIEISFLIK